MLRWLSLTLGLGLDSNGLRLGFGRCCTRYKSELYHNQKSMSNVKLKFVLTRKFIFLLC